jgi:hypothetical protein
MSKTVIHLRDPKIPTTAVHFLLGLKEEQLLGLKEEQLTDDPKKVTCGTCRKMMERQKCWRERKGEDGHS